jgi:hypothetical protein
MDQSSSATVLPNIGPRGCKRRATMGWVWIAVGAVAAFEFVRRDVPLACYPLLAIPFFMGALGYFQAREQTCVFHAARSQRNMDSGPERLVDPRALALVRRQAARVWMRSVVASLVLTGIVVLLRAIVR